MSLFRKGRSFGRSPFLLRRLEDRILFDAALDPAMSADELDASGEASSFDGPSSGFVEDVELSSVGDSQSTANQASQSFSHELVVVDTSVENYQQLVDDLLGNENASRSFEIVLLDAETDGIEQLTDILSQQTGLDAIHLISHGEDGALRIGNTWLTNETLSGYAGDLAAWGSALSVDGDLLVYGCDLASSDAGRELASSLSALTGADVAASDDDTGAAHRGGDWDLEYTTGSIEAAVAVSSAAQASYAGVLAAGPSVTIDATASVQISEDFTFDVTFNNTGDQTGFGPFIDLIFPVNGKTEPPELTSRMESTSRTRPISDKRST